MRLSTRHGSRRRALLVVAFLLFGVASATTFLAGQVSTAPSVWDGVYTVEQATRGSQLYAASCAECHGGELQGGEGKSLRGDQFWTDWREATVGDLLAYISTNMPRLEGGVGAPPGSLPASSYEAIAAHMLSANGLPAGARELTADASAAVRIIRKDGPGELPATTLARVVGCLAPRGTDGVWRVDRATPPVRTSAGAASAQQATSGDRTYQLKFVLTPLTKLVGHRVAVTGLLVGDGGVDGLNVNTVTSVAPTCD